MYIRVKKKPNGKRAVQIVESIRHGNKVKQKIVRHIGQGISDREVEELKRLANSIIVETENNRQPVLPFINPEEVYGKLKRKETDDRVRVRDLKEEQRVIDGFDDIFGKLYKDLSLDRVIRRTKRNKQWNDILRSVVIARIANPQSKKRTSSFLEQDYGIKIPLEKIYRMMDHVYENEEEIKERISRNTLLLFNKKVDIMFFDVTTIYFESFEGDGLRESGYSKDNKFKETQVVIALITTTAGHPITYELFPGNTYEGHTLIKVIRDLKDRYKVSNVFLAADRGMFTRENLEKLEEEGIKYVVGAKLRSMPKGLKEEILGSEYRGTVVNNEINWIKEIEYKKRRLIVSYSRKRAKKDNAERERLIERLLKKVKCNKIKLSEVIPNYGTKKYIKIEGKTAEIDEEKIERDRRWDGLHGIITNEREEKAEEIISRYRGLWQIEEAFRVSKHDLKMRPIYHWTEKRIRAHISICFIAYALVKQALHRIRIQYMPMSLEQLRNELSYTQSSIIMDVSTKKKYCIPSKITKNQKKLYRYSG